MAVTLNSALSGQLTADNPAINVVFPSSQEITISGPDDTITPVDNAGNYVALATEAKQDTIIAAVDGVETLLTTIEANQLPDNHNVTVTSSALPTGASTEAKQDTIISHVDGIETLLTTIEGNQLPDNHNVTVSASALPTGAATEAKQDTIIGHVDGIETLLTNIDAGVPASLGQTAMSASMPVVIASDQSAIPVSQSGTWTVFTSGYQGTLVDRSGQATGVSSQIAAANPSRRYFFITNISNSIIWMDFGTAAVAGSPSIPLDPGDTFVMEHGFISTQQINIIASSGTRDFVAKEG